MIPEDFISWREGKAGGGAKGFEGRKFSFAEIELAQRAHRGLHALKVEPVPHLV